MTRRTSSTMVLLGAVALAVATVTTLSAQYEQAFVNAYKAYRAGQWERAAALFERARELNPNETGRVRISGNDAVAYTPSFLLADSYMRAGNCSNALIAFDAAESRAGNDRGLLQRIAAGRRKCPSNANASNTSQIPPPEAKPDPPPSQEPTPVPPPSQNQQQQQADARFESARASAQTAIQEASDAERTAATAGASQPNALSQLVSARSLFDDAVRSRNLDRLETASRLATATRDAFRNAVERLGPRPPAGALDGARAVLVEAQADVKRFDALLAGRTHSAATTAGVLLNRAATRLAAPGAGPDDISAAVADARSAQRLIVNATTELGSELSAAGARVEELTQSLGRLERSLENRDAAATDADRYNVEQLKGLLAESARHSATAPTDPAAMRAFTTTAAALQSRINAMTRFIDQRIASASGIPTVLLQAAQEYFAGRYDAARSALAQLGAGDPRPAVRLQVALFRAAASYALYLRGGERDRQLLNAATAAVAECRRLSQGYAPDASAFSPRFRNFYASVAH